MLLSISHKILQSIQQQKGTLLILTSTGYCCYWHPLRVSLTNTMNAKANVITASSTKSDIIDAATELISTQEDEINALSKVSITHQEEKQELTYLLIASSIYGLLF